MPDALVRLEVAVAVTGRTGWGARRLHVFKCLLPLSAKTTTARRRARGEQRERTKRVLTALFTEFADEPEAAVMTPDADRVEPARLAAVSFDYDVLDQLIATANERTRDVRRLLDWSAQGEKPFAASSAGRDDPEGGG
jgi:hypothetical protein